MKALLLLSLVFAQTVETGTVEVKGGRLYYEVAGSGPVVVLVHGGFGDRRMWDAQFRELAKRYRVVRYDHRGFGKSPAPTAAPTRSRASAAHGSATRATSSGPGNATGSTTATPVRASWR